jgi:hypothetical protein
MLIAGSPSSFVYCLRDSTAAATDEVAAVFGFDRIAVGRAGLGGGFLRVEPRSRSLDGSGVRGRE